MVTLASPKQPPSERLKDWYPYYAGYTSAFVTDVFECYLKRAESVVDPWNGSGTTTAVAADRNVRSVGIDVNPALSVVARARLTPKSVADSLVPMVDGIVAVAERTTVTTQEDDPLLAWLGPAATKEVRRLQHAIHTVSAADDTLEADLCNGDESAPSRLPLITAFFYSALFAATRDLLRPFRASNPTWMVMPSSPYRRLRPGRDTIRARFVERVTYLSSRLKVTRADPNELVSIRTGRASVILAEDQSFDACLTSPPYATRIDYIKGSVPELSILGLSARVIADLRQQTTGTPVVRGVNRAEGGMPEEAEELVTRVARHESHGSASYYAPWLRNYLAELHEVLDLIAARVRPGGRIALVVQDSYYKSLHIDLQRLVTKSLEAAGRDLIDRHDFPVRHSMTHLNSRARSHLSSRKHRESLLLYQ